MPFNWFVSKHYLQSDIFTRCSYICLHVPTGLIGSPTTSGPPPSPGNYVMPHVNPCPLGTCFRQNMCIPTESGGFQCSPCPDGYTGDGTHCDDVDEVGIIYSWVCLRPCNHLLKVAFVFNNLWLWFSASLTRVSLASRVWTLLLAFAVGNALWDTLVQR